MANINSKNRKYGNGISKSKSYKKDNYTADNVTCFIESSH